MELVLTVVCVIIWAISSSKEAAKKKAAKQQLRPQQPLPRQTMPYQTMPRQTMPQQSSQPASHFASPVVRAGEFRREQMRENAQWQEAKRKQDDAGQLHSVRIDSCESKLESLRVLYEAGILDREEYIQRMERVKARHNQR